MTARAAGRAGLGGLGSGRAAGLAAREPVRLDRIAPHAVPGAVAGVDPHDGHLIGVDQPPHLDVRHVQDTRCLGQREQLLLDLHTVKRSYHGLTITRTTYCVTPSSGFIIGNRFYIVEGAYSFKEADRSSATSGPPGARA